MICKWPDCERELVRPKRNKTGYCKRHYQRTEEARQALSCRALALWQDSDYVAKTVGAMIEAQDRPEIMARKRATSLALWENEKYRELQSSVQRSVQNRPEVKARIAAGVRAAHERGAYDEMFASEDWLRKNAETSRGERNGNWQGGTKHWPYTLDWPEVRTAIRRRDNHRCVECGIPENGRAHDVHHRDGDKRNNDPSNLITLCKSHHGEVQVGVLNG